MAETTHDLRGMPREEAYAVLEEQLTSVLAGIDDPIAGMATVSALVHHGFGHLWTGFYQVAEAGRLLRVGPYQGTVGCLEIAFGRGVCGTAASERRTIIVPDVSAFPGHIVCDARARSEIVVPVFDARRTLIAVLDIDSSEPAAFEERDVHGLERLVTWFAGSSHAAGDRP
jgi:GAF domain-containing protein